MASDTKNKLAFAGALAALFAAVLFLSGFIERTRPPLPEGFEDEDLALQGSRLKGYSLGFEGLIADWYWMRSLQYIGGKLVRSEIQDLNLDDLRSLNPRLLYPYLDNATDLDPNFMAAYSYGATVLPAVDPKQAIALTEKGIAANPDSWRLHQYLGYIYWRLRDYEKASEVYLNGSRIAGAPPFMQLMAAAMKKDGGSRETAREIYSQMLDGAVDEQTRISAEIRLMELDSLDERDAVNSALAELKERTGQCPAALNEILPMLRGIKLPQGRDFHLNNSSQLTDPDGTPYLLDSNTCKAVVNPISRIPKD